MQPVRYQGKLKKWQDERGFGFIQPETGGKDIFLHVSAVKRSARRPQAGDIIIYELKTKSDGKVCAINAVIKGVEYKPEITRASLKKRPAKPIKHKNRKYKKRKNTKTSNLSNILGLGLGIGIMLLILWYQTSRELSEDFATNSTSSPATSSNNSGNPVTPASQCNIKGNISISTGRKLYHLPGMQDYQSTRIEAIHGERWFCSEQEAIQSGWTKAPR